MSGDGVEWDVGLPTISTSAIFTFNRRKPGADGHNLLRTSDYMKGKVVRGTDIKAIPDGILFSTRTLMSPWI